MELLGYSILIAYILITLLWGLLHYLFKSNYKINKIWEDWFEQQFYCIVILLAFMVVIAAIGLVIHAITTRLE